MQPARHAFLTAILLACGIGGAALAEAGVLISPVVLEIASPRKAITVKVTNGGDRPVTFQTDTFVWQQIEGIDRYEVTDELLVVPPIVEVQAHASQVIRVMLRSPAPSQRERTFRLALEDITAEQATASTGQASISFKVSHSLPIMVAPAGKVLNAIRWKPCTPDKTARTAEACVRLLNAGNRRVKVETLTVAGDGWQQVLQLEQGQNVLAGAEREWRVPLANGQAGAVRAVQVHTAQGGTLQAEDGGF